MYKSRYYHDHNNPHSPGGLLDFGTQMLTGMVYSSI